MSGDNHNQADPPDLDAIREELSDCQTSHRRVELLAYELLTEARRLRGLTETHADHPEGIAADSPRTRQVSRFLGGRVRQAREQRDEARAEASRLRALMAHPDAVAVAFASGLTLADLDEVGGMPAP